MEYISTYTKFNENKLNKWHKIGMIAVGLMMIADYILTYVGMHKFNMITEGNPNMVWLMNLPLSQGILLRLLFVVLIEFMFYIALTSNKATLYKDVQANEYREKPSNVPYGNIVLIAGILANLVPLTAHLIWLYAYEFMIWNIPCDTALTVKTILTYMFTGTV